MRSAGVCTHASSTEIPHHQHHKRDSEQRKKSQTIFERVLKQFNKFICLLIPSTRWAQRCRRRYAPSSMSNKVSCSWCRCCTLCDRTTWSRRRLFLPILNCSFNCSAEQSRLRLRTHTAESHGIATTECIEHQMLTHTSTQTRAHVPTHDCWVKWNDDNK